MRLITLLRRFTNVILNDDQYFLSAPKRYDVRETTIPIAERSKVSW